MISNLAMTSQKQPKKFVVQKMKGQLITVWFKKFCVGCKNLDDQVKSGRAQTMESKGVLQAIGKDPVSSSQRVSGEFGISHPV